MEAFIEQLRVVLPVLGVNALRKVDRAQSTPTPPTDASPEFHLKVRNGIHARARIDADEFIVLEGSTCVANWITVGNSESTIRSYASYKATHDKFVADGTIRVRADGLGEFTRDVPFPSPSRAGAIVLGRSCNGRTSWTYEHGNYDSWTNRDVN